MLPKIVLLVLYLLFTYSGSHNSGSAHLWGCFASAALPFFLKPHIYGRTASFTSVCVGDVTSHRKDICLRSGTINLSAFTHRQLPCAGQKFTDAVTLKSDISCVLRQQLKGQFLPAIPRDSYCKGKLYALGSKRLELDGDAFSLLLPILEEAEDTMVHLESEGSLESSLAKQSHILRIQGATDILKKWRNLQKAANDVESIIASSTSGEMLELAHLEADDIRNQMKALREDAVVSLLLLLLVCPCMLRKFISSI